MRPVKLVLHIGRLQLKGVPAEQRDALVAGLREGLQEAFAQEGVAQRWAESGHRERVRGQVAASADLFAFGEAAARSIVDGNVR